MMYPTFHKPKFTAKHWLSCVIAAALLTGCGGSGSSGGGNQNPDSDNDTNYPIQDASYFQTVTHTTLDANIDDGFSAYEAIDAVYGKGNKDFGSIESPDLYPGHNHDTVLHIEEYRDDQVGDYFKFHIHTHLDGDRDTDKTDRQRNEIKVYGNSDDKLKGTLGKIFEYSWKFRVNGDFKLNSNFTHLFQLKAVKHSGSEDWVNDSQPVLTFTANTKSGADNLEIRHVHYNSNKTGTENNALFNSVDHANVDWNRDIEDQWIEAFVRVDYNENGKLYVTLTKLGEETPMVEVINQNLEMWRSGDDADSDNFVRPKWGIYRSLKDKENMQDQDVDFANFVIKEVKVVAPQP